VDTCGKDDLREEIVETTARAGGRSAVTYTTVSCASIARAAVVKIVDDLLISAPVIGVVEGLLTTVGVGTGTRAVNKRVTL
jgi:hypothetical protein